MAAHSTVRALYGSYNGTLYQVRRSSDNATRDIGVPAPGGFANAAAQDSFCAGTSYVITAVHDQSGRGNDLWYWRDGHLTGVPTDAAPEGAYMVTQRHPRQRRLVLRLRQQRDDQEG